MTWTRTADNLKKSDRRLVGGKAWRLARLHQEGFPTPAWICITTHAYHTYLDTTGLRERVALELHRKAHEEMRWEELWDCATRIRHLFLSTPMPAAIRENLESEIFDHIGDRPAAVRSSAVDEDTGKASFAGLHASYINISGMEDIIKHVRLTWASLWSDAALLYRKEIGLDVAQSAMAVLVQALAVGRVSGVAFTVHPDHSGWAVIEAVHGLNQGLVDGVIEPDRWILHRETGEILSHQAAERKDAMMPGRRDLVRKALPDSLAAVPPLTDDRVADLFAHVRRVEKVFGVPQDVEWTLTEEGIVLLQTRPVTTLAGGEDKQRGWYLSLHKTFDQLVELREKIEKVHIPRMIETARELSGKNLVALSPADLGEEIRRRWEINHHWAAVYWADFIPYAHGVRLFGQFYNDRVQPEDPYEFIDLLTRTNMESMERNRQLQEMADAVRTDSSLLENLSDALDRNEFEKKLNGFIGRFGDLTTGVTGVRSAGNDLSPLLRVVREMAGRPPVAAAAKKSPEALKTEYLRHFSEDERGRAESMLDLARNSYRLRDDDNIHLGRIEARFVEALAEGRRRLAEMAEGLEKKRLKETVEQLDDGAETDTSSQATENSRFRFRRRQLVGQPAGPGLAKARARVIETPDELTAFKSGEILVCDAVDPNMTFVVPLAAGIVERRGGMLIHGAIIAREYGLPCVTGVPQATAVINNGDMITVDGYLGIVTLS